MFRQGFAPVAIIIIAIVLLAAGAGVYLWQTTGVPVSESPAPTPTPAPSPAPAPQPPTDPTANWKTYRNEQYGFEFRYPKEWQVSGKEESEWMPNSIVQVAVFNRSLVEAEKPFAWLNPKSFNVGGHSALDLGKEGVIVELSPSQTVFFVFFPFTTPKPVDADTLQERLLSTFRFIE